MTKEKKKRTYIVLDDGLEKDGPTPVINLFRQRKREYEVAIKQDISDSAFTLALLENKACGRGFDRHVCGECADAPLVEVLRRLEGLLADFKVTDSEYRHGQKDVVAWIRREMKI